MARKTRIEFEGALYHVIVRGNQKRKVFHKRKGDRFIFQPF
jgi:REP element-mobilizing transposase RayT